MAKKKITKPTGIDAEVLQVVGDLAYAATALGLVMRYAALMDGNDPQKPKAIAHVNKWLAKAAEFSSMKPNCDVLVAHANFKPEGEKSDNPFSDN